MTAAYLVEAEDPAVQDAFSDRVEDAGYALSDDPDDAIVVSIGGDGSILYNAEQYGAPTMLPVRYGDSLGRRCTVEPDRFEDALQAIDDDRYDVHEHAKLSAYGDDGEMVRDEFLALNELNLHHHPGNQTAQFRFTVTSPTDATVDTLPDEYITETPDGPAVTVDNAQADGLIVATPFGSTAYYEVITGESFDEGYGVALNNFDRPRTLNANTNPALDASRLRFEEDGEARFALLDKDHKASALLYADGQDPYEPAVGEEITIQATDRTVDIIDPVL